MLIDSEKLKESVKGLRFEWVVGKYCEGYNRGITSVIALIELAEHERLDYENRTG